MYVTVYQDDGVTPDPDKILKADGLEIHRAAEDLWAEYEAWLKMGNQPQQTLTIQQWQNLNANSKRRCRHVEPGRPKPIRP